MSRRRGRSRRPRQSPLERVRTRSRSRLVVGFTFIAIVLSVFATRLVQLQFIDSAAYAARAEQENLVTEVLPASRGNITDRNGEPLAESSDGLMIVADPTLSAPDAPAIATILSQRLHLDYFELLDKLTVPNSRFQYLARRVPAQTATQIVDDIASQGLAGVDTRRDPLRVYPAGNVAANVVGFLHSEPVDGHLGADGAELTFDDLLTGTDGSATFEQSGGVRIPLGDNSVVEPQNGHDLKLTIDRDVQWYTQQVLAETVKKARGDSGTAVVLDSQTGQILALADYPTFDPNNAATDPTGGQGAPSVRDAYEPGSVEKVLTTAALIDQGKVTPTSQFKVPGQIKVYKGTKPIHDYWVHPTLKLTMTGILAKSSNVGTLMAAQRVSDLVMWKYLRQFGIGRPTGAGFNGESSGLLDNPKKWGPVEKATISFGQGMAVSALQMAAAVNTIANNGVYIQPSIIDGKAQTDSGQVVGSGVAKTHRVVSAHTAHQVSRMMEMVTDQKQGTAPGAAIPGYRVAGKTGTAQRVVNGVYNGSTTVSFIGFAPADQPRFLVYVVVHNNRNGLGGGATAGPAFKKIMSYLLQKYAVPPTGSKPARLPVYW